MTTLAGISVLKNVFSGKIIVQYLSFCDGQTPLVYSYKNHIFENNENENNVFPRYPLVIYSGTNDSGEGWTEANVLTISLIAKQRDTIVMSDGLKTPDL